MVMLTRSSERIFNPMRYTGLLSFDDHRFWEVEIRLHKWKIEIRNMITRFHLMNVQFCLLKINKFSDIYFQFANIEHNSLRKELIVKWLNGIFKFIVKWYSYKHTHSNVYKYMIYINPGFVNFVVCIYIYTVGGHKYSYT